jgi:hypothetical protein
VTAVGRTGRVLAALLAAATLAVACGDDDARGRDGIEIGGTATARGPEAWPAPPAEQVAGLVARAGLQLQLRESLVHHVHAHLDVFVDGEHRVVPAAIGIVITDPGVHRFDELLGPSYGGIQECDEPCISPLHTHDATGVIHTESETAVDNTLGQLFTEWDVRLSDTCVGDFCTPDTPIQVYVDGEVQPLAGAAGIALTDQKEIAIVIGRPPSRIPDRGDFSAA